MRAIVVGAYTLMAIWLVLAAILRIVISMAGGIELDALPFLSGALGLVALIVLRGSLPGRRDDPADRTKRDD